MKGIITNVKRMAVHDGKGLRSTIFFKGCPLRCIWCHNPDTLSFEKETAFYSHKCVDCGGCASVCTGNAIKSRIDFDAEKCVRCYKCIDECPVEARVLFGEEWEAEELAEKVLADREFFENSGGGVTLSGGECLAQIDFAEELAGIFHKQGISVDIDTCGFVNFSAFERIIPYTDEFLYDIKAIDAEVHKRCTGQDNAIILDNLKRLDELDCKIEIRYPYVVGFNDGECAKIGEFLAGFKNTRRIKVLGYHSFAKSNYAALGKTDTLPDVNVTREDVQKAVDILSSYGLDAVNGMDGD